MTPPKTSINPASRHPHASPIAPGSHRKITKPHSKRRHGWLVGFGILIGLLLVLHLIGSPIAKSIINRRLAAAPEFSGRADKVKIALWRGALEMNDFTLAESGHEKDPPILHLKKVAVKFALSALFTGKLGGTALIDGAELNITKRESSEPKDPEKLKNEIQEKKEQIQHWQNVLRNAFPVTLTKLEIKNAKIQFIDLSRQPNVNVGIENLHVVATDLQNRPKANGDPLPSKVEITGLMTGNGKLKIEMQLDPIARQPRFAINMEIKELSLPPLNNFLLAYADADVSRGTFELYSEINAQGGAYDGYLKPLLHDLDFRTASDKDKSPAKRLKEKVVSAVTSLLKNDANEQVATKAPFAGNFADNEVDIWTTIVNLLRNAFVQAIRGGFEGQQPTG